MRNPYSCVYTSSYDRGLEFLLKIWPDVKKAVPQAELHIAYGWDLFVRFYSNNPASMAWKKSIDEGMKAEGIIHHDRLSQAKVKELMETCGLWTYPTKFFEISCISAMKAQAYGCIPVVIDYAALETTVQHGIKIKGDIYEKEVREEYKNALIKAFDPVWQESVRGPMMEWANNKFPWANVAKQWIEEFNRDELKEAMDVVLSQDPSAEKYLSVQMQQKWGLKETL
jgi:glycosyltransferase involved in cell wall biosynthesis